MKNYDQILVLDFGSQYNQLIVRRIREMGVYATLVSHDISLDEIKNISNVRGIILSGGPHSVYDSNAFTCDPEIFSLGIPILGICYGMQFMAKTFGGLITKSEICEYGKSEMLIHDDSPLYNHLPFNQIVWMSHGDYVKTLPQGFKKIASSKTCELASIANEDKRLYAVQFHPEVRHTMYGNQILHNFVFKICKACANWQMENFVEEQVMKIKQEVKEKKVLCALSGGVDSAVVATLIHKAIGDHLTCMFIDNGLLRQNEVDDVMKVFQENFHMNIIKIDANERFLKKLKGITHPEEKRKIIGHEFISVFEEEINKVGQFDYLAQGTLYTDIIESGTKTAQTIKSHHNVGGLPKNMNFKLIEPLKVLFKDEVRKLGLQLGLPKKIVNRQPFPGPGLGIRVLGEVTFEKLEIVRQSDLILREEILKANLEDAIWQYFTILPDIASVGVMGDQRTYAYTIAIRAVTSIDGMTADWAKIPYDILEKISMRIVNEVQDVNRVVYDITSKPPSTIEWE